jgi:DNA-binding winged helix-turn-helix (wHTH) protein/tetratricopeptide (TPR) repeat protein
MLKLTDLAARPDFDAGPLHVSPGRRLIEGPAGKVSLEPIVMKVFLLLLDGRGDVVTRDELFDKAWGGVFVGDDSLNRAIARVRKVAGETAPGLFEIETIPRTGYRLTGEIVGYLGDTSSGREPHAVKPVSRRTVVGGTLAAAALAGTAATWWLTRSNSDPHFDSLMQRGRQALRDNSGDGARYLEQAAAIRPHDAKTLGLLSFAYVDSDQHSVQEAERAARRALKLDPRESNALFALLMLQSGILDRIKIEDGLKRILEIDPNNVFVLGSLGQLLHGAGRCRASWQMTERAMAIDPLSITVQFQRVMRLWCLGRTIEADQASNRTMELWPTHPLIRMARLLIFAFTGRAPAARIIVDEEAKNPRFLSADDVRVWHISLDALEIRSPRAIAAAREANLQAAKRSPSVAAFAILILPALGELEAAFMVANGFLLGRGPIVVDPTPEWAWRNTYGLFTPPAKTMRVDPRFKSLADGLGLTEYWRKRVGPDAFLFKA